MDLKFSIWIFVWHAISLYIVSGKSLERMHSPSEYGLDEMNIDSQLATSDRDMRDIGDSREDSSESSEENNGSTSTSIEDDSWEEVDGSIRDYNDFEPDDSNSDGKPPNAEVSENDDTSSDSFWGMAGMNMILISLGSFILLVLIIILFVFLGRRAENHLADRENVKLLERHHEKWKEDESTARLDSGQFGPPPTYDEAVIVYCISQTAETQL